MYQSGRDVGRGAAGTSDASVITLEAGFAVMPATREIVNEGRVFTADCLLCIFQLQQRARKKEGIIMCAR